jgi:integrase
MKSEHVIRRTLADGTVKEYRYARHKARIARSAAGTIRALIEAYKRSPEWAALRPVTREHKLIYLREIEPYWLEPVAGVRKRFVLAVRDELAATRGNATANRFLITFSALLAWAVDREWIEHNPLARVRRLPSGDGLRAWTAEEYARILPRLPEPLRRAAVLASYTGQRRGDLVAMRWSQYDGHAIRLRQQKTGVDLVIPVAAELRAELDAWRGGAVAPHPERHILLTEHGQPWDARYISRMFWQTLGRLNQAWRGLNLHGLRKLAAATLAELGSSEHEIAAITGHTDLATLRIYTRSARQEIMAGAAISRLDKRSV